MPVRKIPKNHLVVTGRYASAKSTRPIEFESLLEKEYMLLLDFDTEVETYHEQPVRIPVSGVANGYVVDLLVEYKNRPTELVEVKPQAYLDKYAEKYGPKFLAAEAYCAKRGWRFVKKTEHDIRTQRLTNLKFLRAYRNHYLNPDDRQQAFNLLSAHGGQMSFRHLLDRLSQDGDQESKIPDIWHMVIQGQLLLDMDNPISPNSLLTMVEPT